LEIFYFLFTIFYLRFFIYDFLFTIFYLRFLFSIYDFYLRLGIGDWGWL